MSVTVEPTEHRPPRYERLEILGRGGMGLVAVGWDRWLRRRVALKIPTGAPGSPSEHLLRREARLAARLEHPAIAAIYDTGEDAEGRPFFVMRLVRGEQLRTFVQRAGRAEAIRAVHVAAEAIAHAHDQGLVHRDLSPGNVLVGEHGAVSIIDWGVAAELGDETAAVRVGTPGFVAPEQQFGALPDPRSDVWSLGALLDLAAGERAPPEIRAIVRKAMEPVATDRYANAGDLAADLAAYESGGWVSAYRYPVVDRIGRRLWPWRYLVAVALLALVAITIQGQVDAYRVRIQRDRAVAADARAVSALAATLSEQALSAWRAGDANAASDLARRSLSIRPDPAAIGIQLATAPPAMTLIGERALPPCPLTLLADGGDVVVCVEDRLATVTTWGGATWRTDGVLGVTAVRRDGDTIVLNYEGGSLRWHDPETGRELRRDENFGFFVHDRALWRLARDRAALIGPGVPVSPCDGPVAALEARMGGGWWVACDDGSLFEIAGVAHLRRPPGSDPIDRIVTTDRATWATTRRGVMIRVDPTGRELVLGEPARQLLPVPDRGVMLVRGSIGRDRLLDPTADRFVFDAPRADAIATGPDGLLSTVSGTVWRQWRLPAAIPVREWRGRYGLSSVSFHPDGRVLAVGDGSGGVIRLDTATGRVVVEDRWQYRVVKAVQYGADGTLAASVVGDEPVRVWRDATEPGRTLYPSTGHARRLIVWSDGAVYAVTYGSSIEAVAPPGPKLLESVEVFDAALDRDEDVALLSTARGVERLHRDGRVEPIDARRAHWVARHRGREASSYRSEVRLYGRGPVVAWDEGANITALAFAGDNLLAVGTIDGWVRLRTLDGALVATLPAHDGRVAAMALSPDRRRLATAGWDARVRLLDLGPLLDGPAAR